MMWFIDKLISLLTFPINWFWESFEKYKETKSIGKIILLFAGSLSGLALIGGLLAWLVFYLINYHIEWVVISGVIIWLYAYVKSKMDKKKAENVVADVPTIDPAVAELQAQAEKGYPIMRNIIYQTAKNVAPDIGAVIPRLLQEIEIPGGHYILAHNTCFYQFKLDKADLRMQYQIADLLEFKTLFQSVCARLIGAGSFPTLQMQNFMDNYGNWYDAVCIDVIEDVGNSFIIQAVFASPAYAEYQHKIQLNQQSTDTNTSVPDANWNDML